MSEQNGVDLINLVANFGSASGADKVLKLYEKSPLWMMLVLSIIANY